MFAGWRRRGGGAFRSRRYRLIQSISRPVAVFDNAIRAVHMVGRRFVNHAKGHHAAPTPGRDWNPDAHRRPGQRSCWDLGPWGSATVRTLTPCSVSRAGKRLSCPLTTVIPIGIKGWGRDGSWTIAELTELARIEISAQGTGDIVKSGTCHRVWRSRTGPRPGSPPGCRRVWSHAYSPPLAYRQQTMQVVATAKTGCDHRDSLPAETPRDVCRCRSQRQSPETGLPQSLDRVAQLCEPTLASNLRVRSGVRMCSITSGERTPRVGIGRQPPRRDGLTACDRNRSRRATTAANHAIGAAAPPLLETSLRWVEFDEAAMMSSSPPRQP